MIEVWRGALAVGLVLGLGAGASARASEAPATLDAFVRGEPVALSAPQAPARTARPARARLSLARDAADLLAALDRLTPATADEPALRSLLARLATVDRQARAHFTGVRAELAAAGAAPRIQARLDRAETRYLTTLGAVAERLLPPPGNAAEAPLALGPALAQELAAAFAALPAPLPRPIHRALPYRPLDLAPRPPRLLPVVVPSYLDPAAGPGTSGDLQSTPETHWAPEILAQAAALDYDYALIYDFVRNDIAREWYGGAVKGAAGTLRSGAGNDVDQASLLIALFRASQLPARYVQGVVRLPVETVAASLGLADDQQVPAALAAAGVAYQVVLGGGRVAAVEVEHTWVAAYAPYANYRGVVVDFSGPVWVPLAPAIHATAWQRATDVLGTMAFDVAAFTASYLATVQPVPPLTLLRQEVEDYLAGAGGDYGTQLGSRAVAERRLELLPSTLPMRVVAVTHEAPTLPADTFHRLRLELRTTAALDSSLSLDHTFDLTQVTGRRLTLSYTPASVDDDEIVNAYGGLDSVPPYLVEVLPQLKLGGRIVATGTEPIGLALPHRVAVTLSGPGFSRRNEHLALSGAYSALAVSAPGDVAHLDPAGDPADTEHLAARLLNQIAQRFAARWGAAENELAGLLDVGLVRPSAALTFAHNSLRVELLLDIPLRTEWEGVTLDAAHRIAQPAANSELSTAAEWWTLAALQGSALERFTFEQEFQVAAVSADAGLGRARDLGLTVEIATAANVDAILATVALAPEVEAAIRQLALAGHEVELPAAEIDFEAWQGAVWRAVDPATGAAGHFISGGLAGGATATPPGDWILGFLADALAAPYTGEPNDDPLAAAVIEKLPAGDHQRTAVGTAFALPLEVRVRDILGRPVQGAEVLFTSFAGGGTLLDGEGNEGPALATLTDARGIAAVDLQAGIDTATNPAYEYRDPGDEALTRMLRHEVLAWVANRSGGVGLAEAFVGLGFPGAVTHLARSDTTETHFLGDVGMWSDTIPIEARDAYGNAVSNYPFRFEVAPPSAQDETCTNQSPDFLNAAVFDPDDPDDCVGAPVIGNCGGPLLARTSAAQPVRGGVILGSSASALYTVVAVPDDDPDVPPAAFTYASVWDQNSASGRCSPFTIVRGISPRLTDNDGNNIQATWPAEEYAEPIEIRLLGWDADDGWICTPYPDGSCGNPLWWGDLESGSWVPAFGNLEFEVGNDGAATLPENPERGLYRTRVTTGPVPGENILTMNTTEVQWEVQLSCPPCTLDCPEAGCEDDCSGGGYPEYCRQCPLCTLDCPGAGCTADCDPLDPPPAACSDTGRGEIALLNLPQYEEPQQINEVWGVEPEIAGTVPSPVPLSDDGGLLLEMQVGYTIAPPAYVAGSAEVEILVEGAWNGAAQGSSRSTGGEATVQRGYPFSLDDDNTLELVLNRGSAAELRSTPLAVPLAQTIFRPRAGGGGVGSDLVANRRLAVSQDIDLLNQRYCSEPDLFFFTLTQEANVTFRLEKLNSLNPDGSPVYEAAVEFLADELLAAGEHSYSVTPGNGAGDLALAPGDYRFTLTAVSTATGLSEELVGTARSELRTQDHLPIGHVLVEGVDLFDGHLTLLRSDLAVPGRGPALEFRRSFSSQADRDLRALGLGWTHNYDSHLTVTRCGEVVLIGGEGSGMRFVDDGAGGLTPLKGHHGTLVANAADSSFDFYSKNGTRHHYRFDSRAGHWLLDHIADTNGNRTQLTYDTGSVEALLLAVTDPAGRRLDFSYENRTFYLATEMQLASGPVLVQVAGPDSMAMSFDYDGTGHLTRAAREADARVELYTYAPVSDPLVPLRQSLVSVTNGLNGAVTSYQYQAGRIGVLTEIEVPRLLVTQVARPEGGVTGFVYDLGGLQSRSGPELVHQVVDPRSFTTVYRLDQYGAPLAVTDPLGNTTTMTWTPDDVLMTSRTDANSHTTTFTYDAHGNLLSESLEVLDVTGATTTEVLLNTYWPPAAFNPPYVKERLASRTDRNGHTTTFEYDPAGNLTRSALQVGSDLVQTRHSYLPNGDRASTTDPRNAITTFTYDPFGNLATVRDPLGRLTTTEWNARSLRTRQVDALARESIFTYDALGRLLTKTMPLAAVESTVYDDIANLRTHTDAERRVTTERFDLEGRPVETVNAALGRRLTDYDPAGNKTLASSWFDAATPRFDTLFEYDDAGRLSRRLEPLGRVTDFAHDAAGNVTRETLSDSADPAFPPRVRETDYDALDRPIRHRRFLAGSPVESTMLLDGEGNLLAATNPLDRVTEHAYDALDRRTETLGPEWQPGVRQQTTFEYDGNGNLVREVRFNEPFDQERTFTYDPLNRPLTSTSATGGTTTFEYDAVGNLIRETDPNGSLVSHFYDALYRRERTVQHLTRVTVPTRTVTTHFGYDLVGNRTGEEWPNGNVVTHAYDALDRLTATSDSLGAVAGATYDARGNPLTTTDANGNLTVNTYDALDRLVAQALPENRTVASTYDAAGNLLTATDARTHTTEFTYDTLDRQTSVLYPTGDGESATYDLAGNRLSATNRRGLTTTFDYDALDRLVLVTDPPPLVTTTAYSYDAVGNRLTETDRRNLVTRSDYDTDNRLVRSEREGLTLRTLAYDDAGNKIEEIDADNRTKSFEYDERHLLVAVLDALTPYAQTFTFDDMGDRLITSEGLNAPGAPLVEQTYDLRRRPATETRGGNETTTYELDGNGNRTAVIRPLQTRWEYDYDGADRLTAVRDPLLNETTYAYDENGNLTAQTDAEQQTTSFTYDALDRRLTKTYADSAVESAGYDGNGNLTSKIDALGRTILYEYDTLDRRTLETYELPQPPLGDDLLSIATTYDPNGNPTAVTETYSGPTGVRTTTKTYDTFDRPTSVTDAFGETLAYTYSPVGLRTTLTDPDGKVTRYFYDAQDRPTRVELPGAETTAYDYVLRNWVGRLTYPHGITVDHTYDGVGRKLAIVHRFNQATWHSQFDYTYDANGNRLTQHEHRADGLDETTTYLYDDADRLTEVTYPDRTVTHSYDGVGNRLTELAVDSAGTTVTDRSYNYNSRHQLTTITDHLDPAASATYAYDANGNQTAKSVGAETTHFTFDIRNRLAEILDPTGTPLGRYLYDYQGLRVEKTTAAETRHYTYDDQSLLVETDPAGETLAKYDYGADRLITLDDPATERQYYLFDALGSVVELLEDNRASVARYQWDAWGRPRGAVGGSVNAFGFTGYQWDGESGLNYAKARYYDGELGRFLSEDPAEGTTNTPPSLHKYLYAFDNPTVWVDPSGQINLGVALEEIFKAGEKITTALKDQVNASDRTQDGFGRELASDVTKALSIAGGSLELAAEAVNQVNRVVNIALLSGTDEDGGFVGGLRQQAKSELAREFVGGAQTVTAAIQLREQVLENPVKAGVQFGLLVTEQRQKGLAFIRDLQNGDPDAVYELGKMTTKLVAGLVLPTSLNRARMTPIARGLPATPLRGVTFFGDDAVGYYLADEATLGGRNQQVWFIPAAEGALVTSPAAAARYTGNAPSVTKAWLEGREIFGVSFPTAGRTVRRPTLRDAGGYPHFQEGGHTSVRLPGDEGGFLMNPVTELLTPGGSPVPEGSVLFKVEPNGAWTPVRKY